MVDYIFGAVLEAAPISVTLQLERLAYRLAYWLHQRHPERRHL